MMRLYYSPGACSMAVHVVLNEMGLPFEHKLINLEEGENQTPEFLKLNPRGQVPVLVIDDLVVRESTAIILYLMEEYNSTLIPRSGKTRAKALEWLLFANSTLQPAYGRASFIVKTAQDPAAKDQLFRAALDKIHKLWAEVDTQLSKNRYICGNTVTVADIYLTVIANWGDKYPQRPALGDNVKRMLREIIARPGYSKALKAEQVEYKAAA